MFLSGTKTNLWEADQQSVVGIAAADGLLVGSNGDEKIVKRHSGSREQNRITSQEGAELVTNLFQILLTLHSSPSLLPRAYELSSKVRMGVYDCLYVALAERESCLLVTTDEKLMKNLPGYPIISLDSL